jgi:hypothetical protein
VSPGAPRLNGTAGLSGAKLQAPEKPSIAKNPSLPTFVGLLLMILAFFVVLTSISLRDSHKANAVTVSLQQTFSGGANMPRDAVSEAVDDVDQTYVQSLAKQFQSYVPMQAGAKSSAGYEQHLALPMDQVFDPEATDAKPVLQAMLGQLMTALQRRPADMDYELEIRLAEAELSDLHVDRAAGIAATLARLRAPAEKFTIGVIRSTPPTLEVIVRLRPNVRPIGTGGAGAPAGN